MRLRGCGPTLLQGAVESAASAQPPLRKGYVGKGGSVQGKRWNIRNQDTSIESNETDLDVEDMSIE